MNFPGTIKSKRQQKGTTIFSVMSALANETNAINLSQGFPDFSISSRLIELVHKHMKAGHNQYAPMPGIPSLRVAIAEKIYATYSKEIDFQSEITITAGATQAIYTAITATINEGDEVILFDPAYDCYVPAIELNNGIAVQIPLSGPDFRINWEDVKKRVNQKTRMIIINTPHNPTGAILTAGDMLKLEKIVQGTDIIILSDEVYEHVIFDNYEHQSVLRFPRLAERSFVVFSFGKTFHATGWKVGYCIAPNQLMNLFRQVHQFLIFSVNTPMQFALAEFLADDKNYNGIEHMYEKKRDLFRSLLSTSRLKLLPCLGTYFQTVDYSAISEAKDTDYAIQLTKDEGVASIPISVFYNNPPECRYLRFCFAKEDSTLEKAAEILVNL